jgi:UDP-N-acetylglucosamine--N-acetylmuramyl-(pentapeptide) pyrophosphoryl-undecaprenol N-acetylglucosamine transferase
VTTRPIIIMAGGTGGHIFPGLVVARELLAAGVPVAWIGTRSGLEARLVPDAGIELDEIRISGIRGKGLMTLLAAPLRILRATMQAISHLRRRRPGAVLSMGGYAAGPGGIAARILGIPLVVHEQNSIPGSTNRILARFARTVCEGFAGAFPPRAHALHTGNPVRAQVAALPPPEQRFEQHTGPTRVLVLGGSLGAAALNEVVPKALAALDENERPEIWHQAGSGHLETAERAYAEAGVQARVVPFIDEIEQAYGWADLVICRAGGITLAELAAAGVASILIPFPYAVEDHQTANARYLAAAGAAELTAESSLTAEGLAQRLRALCGDRTRLLSMARAARKLARADAGAQVARLCMEAAA